MADALRVTPKARAMIDAGELTLADYEEYAGLTVRKHRHRDRLVIQAPTWVMRAPVKALDDFLEDLADPEKRDSARRDFAGLPGGAIRPFFRNSAVLDRGATDAIVSPFLDETDGQRIPARTTIELAEDFRPVPHAVYAFAADLSVSGDASGFALVHYDMATAEFTKDFSGRVVAERGGRVDYEPIRALVRTLRDRGFRIGAVGFDQYQSNDSFLILEGEGFRVHIVKYSESLMGCNTVHEFVTNGRLRYGSFCTVFIGEAKELQVVNDRRIDHMKSGGHWNSKDVWDAVVNATYLCTELVKEAHGDVLQTEDLRTFDTEEVEQVHPLTAQEELLPAKEKQARQLPNNRHALIANIYCRYNAERDSDAAAIVLAAVPLRSGPSECRILHAETLRATPETLVDRLALMEKEWCGRGFFRTRRGQDVEFFAPQLHFLDKLKRVLAERAPHLALTSLDVQLSEDVRIRGVQAATRDGRVHFPSGYRDSGSLRAAVGQLVAYPFVPNTYLLLAVEGVYRAAETVDFTTPRQVSRVLGYRSLSGSSAGLGQTRRQ